MVAVTLLHRKGYFFQQLDGQGHQYKEPGAWLLVLVALAIQLLEKIPLPVQQRYRYHGQPQIGCAAEGITGQDAESPALRRDMAVERNLHRKIGNGWECERVVQHACRLS